MNFHQFVYNTDLGQKYVTLSSFPESGTAEQDFALPNDEYFSGRFSPPPWVPVSVILY